MPGGEQVGADLARRDQQLVKLQMVVAQAARNRRPAGEVLVDERAHDIVLEARLLIDHVIRNAQLLGHVAGVVDIVDGAAASLHRLGHALVTGKATLVPKLQGQANDVVAALAQHGRDGRGIDTAGHGDGNGLVLRGSS